MNHVHLVITVSVRVHVKIVPALMLVTVQTMWSTVHQLHMVADFKWTWKYSRNDYLVIRFPAVCVSTVKYNQGFN